MKKLILTDLDGTLVNSKKEIPSNFYDVYQQLKQQDITLGIATGRSYSSIKRDFASISDDSFFIADGGSVVIYQGEVIKTFPVDKQSAIKAAITSQAISNSFVIMCCVDKCYTLPIDNPAFLKQINIYHDKHVVVDDFSEIKDEIIKVSIYCGDNNSQDHIDQFKTFQSTHEVVLGGADWIDVCAKGVSKASGLKVACDLFGIKMDDIIAFGDYMNDYQLLKSLNNSYAMANAHPKIKEICKYQIGYNDDNAVLNTLIDMFNLVMKS